MKVGHKSKNESETEEREHALINEGEDQDRMKLKQ